MLCSNVRVLIPPPLLQIGILVAALGEDAHRAPAAAFFSISRSTSASRNCFLKILLYYKPKGGDRQDTFKTPRDAPLTNRSEAIAFT